jgi:DcuC family C4-dicarboxylate transporter
MTAAVSLLIVATTVYAILRRAEVRLTLLLGALALGAVTGDVDRIVRTFLATLTNEQYLIPLGCSLGFAYVLRETGCDRHLVHVLARPLRRVRWLLVPGVVVVGTAVNVPIISQAGTVTSIGPVLVPLLRAARVSPVTSGAALLLGCSLGGDLLNPGSPEMRTVSTDTPGHPGGPECVKRVVWLLPVHLAVSATVFWALSRRAEARWRKANPIRPVLESGAGDTFFRVNLFKAAIPLVPVALLFLTALPPPFRAFTVLREWLVSPPAFAPAPGQEAAAEAALRASFDSRLIGAAMLVGTVLAGLTAPRRAGATVRAFFEGTGFALARIISLIVVAVCFGKGVEHSGLAARLGRLIEAAPGLLLPAAAALPLAFGWACGSGMASTQSLFTFFVPPAAAVGVDPLLVGAVVSLSAAAGRTMSPVAAVVLMCAALTETQPLELVRRVALPVAAGVLAMLLTALAIVGR